eukprot:CAMPEP_0170447980 /NCGR_PEP_ID=MMETSP0117_2-20130122/50464_1 /TAXON_ID=400756 /ORGANISM="Durinskia baltica, Strain CSIRO CS-38" /LENGTH=95 /DNA_ID=CAMNT_0010709119 /DNA_START=311 /DNA_END=594 /DNA_ORIENTATION=-
MIPMRIDGGAAAQIGARGQSHPRAGVASMHRTCSCPLSPGALQSGGPEARPPICRSPPEFEPGPAPPENDATPRDSKQIAGSADLPLVLAGEAVA